MRVNINHYPHKYVPVIEGDFLKRFEEFISIGLYDDYYVDYELIDGEIGTFNEERIILFPSCCGCMDCKNPNFIMCVGGTKVLKVDEYTGSNRVERRRKK